MTSLLIDVNELRPCTIRLGAWRYDAGMWALREKVDRKSLDPDVAREGQVLWVAEFDDAMVGIEWGWARLKRGPVVMANALAVTTNAVLVGEDGLPVMSSEKIFCLTRTIYGLGWETFCKVD